MKRVKAEDFIGATFGTLTITSVEKKNNRSYCNCQCKCGNIIQTTFSNLRTGNTTSCGNSIHKEFFYNDLLNKNFGKLKVIEKTDERKDGKVIWKCLCSCGNVTKVRSDYLISGHTTSCGCCMSKGEDKIANILRENGISFIKHKYVDDCIFPTEKGAFFDFYLEPDYNNKIYISSPYYIEYDGIQHFKSSEYNSSWNTGKQLTKQKLYDKIKNEYCIKQNIPLIRIPYTHYNDLSIKDLLLDTTTFLVKGDDYNAE